MKRYEVIEDNGGGLTLVIFDKKDRVEYLHTDYEYVKRQLIDDLKALKDGDNPIEDWEGNEENPQIVYENIISFEYGWKVIANNDGIYPDKMGITASLEFEINR